MKHDTLTAKFFVRSGLKICCSACCLRTFWVKEWRLDEYSIIW